MKKILIIAFVISLFAFQSNSTKMEENNLLDGTTVTYNYEGLGTVHLEFYDGFIKYEWLEGDFTGYKGEDHQYKATKIGNKTFMVHWVEKSDSSLVTLVLNFKKNSVNSSAMLHPKTENEAVLFHHAEIRKQQLVVN